jgi:hypothetical protein
VLRVKNATDGDYVYDPNEWMVTSERFSVLLGADSAAGGSSAVLSATSSASFSPYWTSEASNMATSTRSASTVSFTQPGSSNAPEVSALSGAPTLGPAPPKKPLTRSNTGAIAGGVVGGLIVLAIILGAILLLLKRRRNKEKKTRLGTKGAEEVAQYEVNDGEFVPQIEDHRPADADLPEWVDSDRRT